MCRLLGPKASPDACRQDSPNEECAGPADPPPRAQMFGELASEGPRDCMYRVRHLAARAKATTLDAVLEQRDEPSADIGVVGGGVGVARPAPSVPAGAASPSCGSRALTIGFPEFSDLVLRLAKCRVRAASMRRKPWCDAVHRPFTRSTY
jgi:hypothetical protein